MITNKTTAFSTYCRHSAFGHLNEKNYLCSELFNKRGSYAFFNEDVNRRTLYLLYY